MTEEEYQNRLPSEICDRIEVLSEEGNQCFDAEDYQGAIAIWKRALSLIPAPRNTYGESQWLETAIGDAYFMTEDYANALAHLLNAKANIERNAYENPFIMLRVGQAFFEQEQPDEAREYLLRAYMFEGEEIFESEHEKYLDFLEREVELD